MDALLHSLMGYWWIFLSILLIVGHKLILKYLFGIVFIPKNTIGIVNKKWVLTGKNKNLPDGAIIALNGEAGIQADTLAPGIHFGYWAWQYSVNEEQFVTIDKNKIGIVEAKDGCPLSMGRVLGKTVDCNSFQNAREFLANGGQRGPQISIIPPGTYRINTSMFTVAQETYGSA